MSRPPTIASTVLAYIETAIHFLLCNSLYQCVKIWRLSSKPALLDVRHHRKDLDMYNMPCKTLFMLSSRYSRQVFQVEQVSVGLQLTLPLSVNLATGQHPRFNLSVVVAPQNQAEARQVLSDVPLQIVESPGLHLKMDEMAQGNDKVEMGTSRRHDCLSSDRLTEIAPQRNG